MKKQWSLVLKTIIPFILLLLSTSLALGDVCKGVEKMVTTPITWIGTTFGDSVGGGAGEAVADELRSLFHDTINPFADKITSEFARLGKENILLVEGLVDETLLDVSEIEQKAVNDINQILATAETSYHEGLRATFEEINRARAEAVSDVRSLVGFADSALEERIDQLAFLVMGVLAQSTVIAKEITSTAKEFWPEKIHQKLIAPTIRDLEKLEEQIFRDLNELIDRIHCLRAGAIEDLRTTLEETIAKLPRSPFKKRNACEIYYQDEQGLVKDTDIYRYRVAECVILTQLEEKIDKQLTIRTIVDQYAQLQINAYKSYCKFEGIGSAKDIFQRDWIEYGKRQHLWERFLDNP